MSKNTITAAQVSETIESLTAKGRETMTAIATGQVSFFDEGLVEGSGIWGGVLTDELGHKSSGVINRLRDLGLFSHNPHDPADGVDAGGWWSLTALGAEVAKSLAESPAEVELCNSPKPNNRSKMALLCTLPKGHEGQHQDGPKKWGEAEAKKAPAKKATKKTEAAPGEVTEADTIRAMAGYRVHTKSRSTKTTAVLVDGQEAKLDTDGGRWQLICLDHDFIVADPAQRHARDVLSHPEEWCGPCGKAFRKAAKAAQSA